MENSNQVALGSYLKRLMTVVDAQLGVNGTEMIAYRACRKVKRLRDLRVREAAFGQA